MKTTRLLTISLTFVVLLGSVGFALAQGPKPRLRQETEFPERALMAIVRANPEQRQQIRTVRQNYHEQLKTARENLVTAQRSLQDALLSSELTNEAIEPYVQEVISAQSAMVRLRADMELEIRQLLTPEQVEQLKTFREKSMSLHAEFHKNRGALWQELRQGPPK